MAFTLTEAQQAVVDNRGGGLLVSAAAGSGKTRVLVERLLDRVCKERLDLDRFLVITFTNAAAAELRGRVVEELNKRLADDPGDRHLRRQTTLVYKAQISTIHAFCAALLREWGHLIDLDPDFRLCDEGEAGILRLRALERVMEERYENLDARPGFTLLVDTMSAGRDDSRLMQIVLDIYGKVQSHPDPQSWLEGQAAAFDTDPGGDAGDTPWGALLLEDTAAQAEYWHSRLAGLLELTALDEKLSKGYGPSLAESAACLAELAEQARGGSWDGTAQAAARLSFPRFGTVRNCERPDLQETVKTVRELCKKRMEKLTGRFADTSASLLSDLKEAAPAIRALVDLVKDYGESYRGEKARRRLADFSDLEHLTLALLLDGDGNPTPLARQLGGRYDEIMVDEYQDTNQVQNAIFSALSRGEQNLFMVGDVKQSIYRFRLADPTLFLARYRDFAHYKEAGEGQPRKIILSQNFRSRPEVLDGVNFLFRNLMSRQFGELDYGDDEALYPGARFPPSTDNAVELAVLDLDAADMEYEGPKPDKNLMEARWAAGRIRRLLDGGLRVTEGEGARPIRPGDITILLRSPGVVLHHYARALSEAGIPWEADGGGDYFETNEVAVALSLLRIIDNPRQDVPLISALRSPVYGFSADRLSQIRAARPEGDFYSALEADGGEDCAAFLGDLAELRFSAGDKRTCELVWDLYEVTGLPAIVSAMPGGEERRANLLALYECARSFESSGHKGLFAFLTHLERLRETGANLSTRRSAGGDGVKLMSIHRAKGLEYPVVLLCGLARRFNREDTTRPVLFHPTLGIGPKGLDRERGIEYPTLARTAVAHKLDREMMAEELRLLYVALTRAKEKLILSCALGAGAKELTRIAQEAACPPDPEALAGAQSAAQWVLMAALCRPDAQGLRDAAQTHIPLPMTAHFGMEWDIQWVNGSPYAKPMGAARAVEAVQTAPPPLPADLDKWLTWQYPHRGVCDVPSKVTATQLKGRTLDEESAQDAPQPPRPVTFRRPDFAGEAEGLSPTERGTALHLAMQFLDFSAACLPGGPEGELERLERQGFLTSRQRAAVDPAKIAAFFASPIGRELMASPRLEREFKFSILDRAGDYYPQAGVEEQVLLQGVVDCWFEGPDGELTVLDFKTDRRPDPQGYAPQVGAYARALERMTGKPVTRRALYFFSTGETFFV